MPIWKSWSSLVYNQYLLKQWSWLVGIYTGFLLQPIEVPQSDYNYVSVKERAQKSEKRPER